MTTERELWQGYTILTDLDKARVLFERRHGYTPVTVFKQGSGSVLAGPIGEKPPSLTRSKPEATTPERARGILQQLELGLEVSM